MVSVLHLPTCALRLASRVGRKGTSTTSICHCPVFWAPTLSFVVHSEGLWFVDGHQIVVNLDTILRSGRKQCLSLSRFPVVKRRKFKSYNLVKNSRDCIMVRVSIRPGRSGWARLAAGRLDNLNVGRRSVALPIQNRAQSLETTTSFDV